MRKTMNSKVDNTENWRDNQTKNEKRKTKRLRHDSKGTSARKIELNPCRGTDLIGGFEKTFFQLVEQFLHVAVDRHHQGKDSNKAEQNFVSISYRIASHRIVELIIAETSPTTEC